MAIDRAKLLGHLTQKDKQREPYDNTTDLVVGAIYAGLADQIRRGDFDEDPPTTSTAE